MRAHALTRSERLEVEEAMAGGTALESPRLRAAVVVLYALSAVCLVAAVVPLCVDGRTAWTLTFSFIIDATIVTQFVARPFLRRRNWQRAIDRNGAVDAHE